MERDRRQATSTSSFGVGRRENHDATDFYARFALPELSSDDTVHRAPDLGDGCILGDARAMSDLPDSCVALVVTSPPYFAGKAYEQELGEGHVPASYAAFLDLLRDVFSECKRVLEPGGRIAVNVANLGRKPYRSLSADVIRILQDDLGLLLRGEVIWKKAEGAGGNCAWGSFRSPANPVLRDITERVVIASKGRFDRALKPEHRQSQGLPWESTLTADEFMNATLDVWDIEPEQAKRVNHPAPFPVGLPERLIHLYTYRDDLVLDPFMGSGTALVAATRTGRRGVGYDLEREYVEIARERLQTERRRQEQRPPDRRPSQVEVAATDTSIEDFQARATREGKAAQAIAEGRLEDAGFRVVKRNHKVRGTGVTINFLCVDADDRQWFFDVTGAFTTTRGGLLRTDSVWKCLGRAHAIRNKANAGLDRTERTPLVFLTSHLPKPGSEGHAALRAAGTEAFFDAMEMLSDTDFVRLAAYASGGHGDEPIAGFWAPADLA